MERMVHVESGDVEALTDALLDDVLSCVSADIAMWYAQGQYGTTQLIRRMHVRTTEPLPVTLDGTGASGLKGSAFDSHHDLVRQRRESWSVIDPSPHHTNIFSCFDDDYLCPNISDLEYEGSRLSVYDSFYGPVEVGDQCRALMYHGRRSLGWFGVYRRGAGERFTSQERDALNARASSFCSRLAAIDALSAPDMMTATDYALFNTRRALTWASPNSRRWLTSARLEVIRAHIRRATYMPIFLDGVVLLLVAMSMEGQAQEWLLVMEPCKTLQRVPLSGLPHKTRQVALMLVNGHGAGQIASSLTMSASALNAHINLLYQYFDVRSMHALTQSLHALGST